MPPPCRRPVAVCAIVVAVLMALAACAQTDEGHAEPDSTGMLAGWQLTLPVPGSNGGAKTVKPATITPPWLTTAAAGGLVFWAPVNGVTTAHSEHARTELDRLDGFAAGSGGGHALTASVTVTQLPSAVPEVIVGQIHGAGEISAMPFVLLYYANGVVKAVVKQEQTGEAHSDVPLLTDVPLGTPFDYSIADNGDGNLTFTATAAGHTATGNAKVPAAFTGAPVRFQAGAYQQAPSAKGGAGPDDGARVTFTAIAVVPHGTSP